MHFQLYHLWHRVHDARRMGLELAHQSGLDLQNFVHTLHGIGAAFSLHAGALLRRAPHRRVLSAARKDVAIVPAHMAHDSRRAHARSPEPRAPPILHPLHTLHAQHLLRGEGEHHAAGALGALLDRYGRAVVHDSDCDHHHSQRAHLPAHTHCRRAPQAHYGAPHDELAGSQQQYWMRNKNDNDNDRDSDYIASHQ